MTIRNEIRYLTERVRSMDKEYDMQIARLKERVDSIAETLDILGDEETMEALKAGIEDIKAGRVTEQEQPKGSFHCGWCGDVSDQHAADWPTHPVVYRSSPPEPYDVEIMGGLAEARAAEDRIEKAADTPESDTCNWDSILCYNCRKVLKECLCKDGPQVIYNDHLVRPCDHPMYAESPPESKLWPMTSREKIEALTEPYDVEIMGGLAEPRETPPEPTEKEQPKGVREEKCPNQPDPKAGMQDKNTDSEYFEHRINWIMRELENHYHLSNNTGPSNRETGRPTSFKPDQYDTKADGKTRGVSGALEGDNMDPKEQPKGKCAICGLEDFADADGNCKECGWIPEPDAPESDEPGNADEGRCFFCHRYRHECTCGNTPNKPDPKDTPENLEQYIGYLCWWNKGDEKWEEILELDEGDIKHAATMGGIPIEPHPQTLRLKAAEAEVRDIRSLWEPLGAEVMKESTYELVKGALDGNDKLMTERDKLHNTVTELLKTESDLVKELRAEVERLNKRDGNAAISLAYATEYPFNFEDLEVVDFGVADNGYVVKSAMFDKIQDTLKAVRGLVKEIEYYCEQDMDMGDYRETIESIQTAIATNKTYIDNQQEKP